jgi:MFS family permease
MTLVGALGLSTLLSTGDVVFAVVGTVLFGAGISGFWPVTMTMITRVFPDDSLGGDFGASRMTFVGLGALGPTYIGFVAERMSYSAAFVGLIGCLLASGTIIAHLLRGTHSE